MSGLFGAPERKDWRHETLGFIRRITGQPAKYPDCTTAAAASNLRTGEPDIGGFCWYATRGTPHGNVSLYLGDRTVLAISGLTGGPTLVGVMAPILGGYLGWSKRIGPDNEEGLE